MSEPKWMEAEREMAEDVDDHPELYAALADES
jgi:hypothetical protein